MTRVSLRAVAGALLGAASLIVCCTPTTSSAAVPGRQVEARAHPHGATSGGNGINDVACVSTGDCVAVGQYAVPRGFKAFLDEQRGSTWSEVTAPLPSFANTTSPQGELSGVACTSGTSCVAVGSVSDTKRHTHGLLLTEVGGSWRSIAVPLPAGANTATPDAALEAVSCASSAACVAVGSYEAADGHNLPLVDTESSGTWRAVVSPLPPNGDTPTPDDQLAAVDCTAGGSCTAVGSYVESGGGDGALLVTETSGSWSDVVAPLPGDASAAAKDEFDSISCTSGNSCVAVGSYGDEGGNQQALLDSEVSGTWTNVVAGLPGDANGSPSLNVLNGVSCSSSGNCVAVGVYETEDNYQEALVEVEGAGSWFDRPAVLPADANTVIPFDTLNAVSCPADGNCVAVGFYSSKESYVYPKALLEVESGGSWVAGGALAPTNESTLRPYSQLSTVSCVSILGCMAGGVYSDLKGDAQALLDSLGVELSDVSVVPGSPTDVTARAGRGAATVSWRPPTSNGGSRITDYTVTASPGGRHCVTVRTSCTVRPLAATGYSFSVTAASVVGTSAPSPNSVPVLVLPTSGSTVALAPFAAGSSALSTTLLAQIRALAARIVASGDTRVRLVGYDDDVASASRSLVVSAARAHAVLVALSRALRARRADDVTVTAAGAGRAHPVASDATAAGRAQNRRVEASTS